MHIIFVVQTIFVDELFHAMTLIVNDGCPLWRERLVIPFVRTGRPDSRHHKLPCNGCDAGPEVAELRRHQADDDIKNAIRCHGRKELSIDHLGDPLHRHPERIVDFAQRDIQHKKKRKDGQIALP